MTVLFDFKDIFNPTDALGKLVEFLVLSAIATVIVVIVLAIEKRVLAKRLKNQKNIKLRFMKNLVRGMVITIAAVWVLVSASATSSFGKVIFQGTAVLTAVVGLAAQAVISDLLCGFMISANRPFEIGDRLELDNGVKGIVMDITPRHVVIRKRDTIDAIIPNSKINACVISNMSHNTKVRSVDLRFHVGYQTDVEECMNVIQQAVMDSEHTIPAWKGEEKYGPVYFMSYGDSYLEMATTVYYNPTSPSEAVISDVNLRVGKALKAAGIEIPYNHVSVVMKDAEGEG